MYQKNTFTTRKSTTFGLAALAILVASALVTKQFVGVPIALLMLFSWGGMFVLQFILPLVVVLQIALWLNRKLSV